MIVGYPVIQPVNPAFFSSGIQPLQTSDTKYCCAKSSSWSQTNNNVSVCFLTFCTVDVKQMLLERGYGQARMESFLSQKDAQDRADFSTLNDAMQAELNRENRWGPLAIASLIRLADSNLATSAFFLYLDLHVDPTSNSCFINLFEWR